MSNTEQHKTYDADSLELQLDNAKRKNQYTKNKSPNKQSTWIILFWHDGREKNIIHLLNELRKNHENVKWAIGYSAIFLIWQLGKQRILTHCMYSVEIAEIFPHYFFFLQKFRKINAFSTKYCMLVSRFFFSISNVKLRKFNLTHF